MLQRYISTISCRCNNLTQLRHGHDTVLLSMYHPVAIGAKAYQVCLRIDGDFLLQRVKRHDVMHLNIIGSKFSVCFLQRHIACGASVTVNIYCLLSQLGVSLIFLHIVEPLRAFFSPIIYTGLSVLDSLFHQSFGYAGVF